MFSLGDNFYNFYHTSLSCEYVLGGRGDMGGRIGGALGALVPTKF